MRWLPETNPLRMFLKLPVSMIGSGIKPAFSGRILKCVWFLEGEACGAGTLPRAPLLTVVLKSNVIPRVVSTNNNVTNSITECAILIRFWKMSCRSAVKVSLSIPHQPRDPILHSSRQFLHEKSFAGFQAPQS
jgi:hypothetical protein